MACWFGKMIPCHHPSTETIIGFFFSSRLKDLAFQFLYLIKAQAPSESAALPALRRHGNYF
ncbi:MAG: hypothetical protein Ct9H300mP28_27940 [Pseudomonadota bacterium]|nr:MAG: hypothetical protein Ct9H300mP28_27940 [Pseudomonadota bacterium]